MFCAPPILNPHNRSLTREGEKMTEKIARLSPQQTRFVGGIIKGKNRTDAYIDAGYRTKSRRNVGAAAARLYANPNVQEELQRREKAVRRRNCHYLNIISHDALDELRKMIRDCDSERMKLETIKAVLDYAALKSEPALAHDGEPSDVVTLKDVVLGLGQRNEAIAAEYQENEGVSVGV